MEILLNSGVSLVQHDFISIIPLPFEFPSKPENIIITSRNAAGILLDHQKSEMIRERRIFCVGNRTAQFLRKGGCNIIESANYGSELAAIIRTAYPGESFLYCCGRNRREELPTELKKHNIKFEEIEVYDTQLTPKEFKRDFDGIMFFSPSGVRSFCQKNKIHGEIFCIGNTTAGEAALRSAKVTLASEPSIENTLVQVVRKFGKIDSKQIKTTKHDKK